MSDKPYVIDYKGEGARLVKFRKKIGLSQHKLAVEIGSHQPFIAKVEKGETTFPAHYLKYLRDRYYLDLNWYFTGRGTMISEQDEKSTLISDLNTIKKDYDDLWKQFDDMRKTLHKLVRDFYDKG